MAIPFWRNASTCRYRDCCRQTFLSVMETDNSSWCDHSSTDRDLLKSLQHEYHFTTIFITHDHRCVPASIADKKLQLCMLVKSSVWCCWRNLLRPTSPIHGASCQACLNLRMTRWIVLNPGTPPSLYTGEGRCFVQIMLWRLTSRKKHLSLQVSDTFIGLRLVASWTSSKVEKPSVIADLHDRFDERWAFYILRTRRKEMSEN